MAAVSGVTSDMECLLGGGAAVGAPNTPRGYTRTPLRQEIGTVPSFVAVGDRPDRRVRQAAEASTRSQARRSVLRHALRSPPARGGRRAARRPAALERLRGAAGSDLVDARCELGGLEQRLMRLGQAGARRSAGAPARARRQRAVRGVAKGMPISRSQACERSTAASNRSAASGASPSTPRGSPARRTARCRSSRSPAPRCAPARRTPPARAGRRPARGRPGSAPGPRPASSPRRDGTRARRPRRRRWPAPAGRGRGGRCARPRPGRP